MIPAANCPGLGSRLYFNSYGESQRRRKSSKTVDAKVITAIAFKAARQVANLVMEPLGQQIEMTPSEIESLTRDPASQVELYDSEISNFSATTNSIISMHASIASEQTNAVLPSLTSPQFQDDPGSANDMIQQLGTPPHEHLAARQDFTIDIQNIIREGEAHLCMHAKLTEQEGEALLRLMEHQLMHQREKLAQLNRLLHEAEQSVSK